MPSPPNLLNDDGSASMATMLMLSHHAFRRDLGRFAKALERVAGGDTSRVEALREEWKNFHGALHGHHHIEDTAMFPGMRAQNAELGSCIDGLAADHINVTLGSLDDPDDIRPIAQTGVESRVVWFQQLPKLPEHESNEGEDGEARHVAIRDSNRQHPDYDTDHWPPEDAP